MPEPNIKRIDSLLQYIITVAGQEEWGNRELGPIHFVKYLYLADLAFAEFNNGKTYTGLPWRFHHFGPWAAESYTRIEPALSKIGAEKRMISHPKISDDLIRFSIQDDETCDKLYEQLDLIVTGSVQVNVRKYGSDTQGLLHYVYQTWPMLRAVPGDFLDFTPPDDIRKTDLVDPVSPQPLSVRQQKKRKEKIQSIRERLKERLSTEKKRRKYYPPPPRYDDVFFEGVKHLDSLAGEEIKPIEATAVFSDDAWKSKARYDPEIS